MEKRKFELFMCCQGNGLTVCNKAVEENGQYKTIAHIANCGKTTWYVNPAAYVSGADLLRIEHAADVQRVAWERQLDALPEAQRYRKLLEAVPVDAMLYVIHLDCDMFEKIEYLKKVCYEKSYF